MIRYEQAKEEDVYDVVSRAKNIYRSEGDLIKSALCDFANGPTICIFGPGNRRLGLVGGVFVWTGVCRFWAILTDDIDLYPVAVSRVLLRLLNWFVKYYNVHRAEMTVKADYLTGIKWAKFFGFEAEGLLRQFGPDKSDYLIFGRV